MLSNIVCCLRVLIVCSVFLQALLKGVVRSLLCSALRSGLSRVFLFLLLDDVFVSRALVDCLWSSSSQVLHCNFLMCVYIYIYIYHIYTSISLSISISIYVYIYIYIYICIYLSIHIYIYLSLSLYLYLYIYISLSIYILWGKSRWLRILSCAIYVKKKWGIDGSTPFKTGQLSHLCP